MENKLIELENEIKAIKERNNRVQSDKAWEVSKTRIVSILIITYIFASIVLYLIGNEHFLLNALIPVLGYFLSTQSLPFIKKWWGTQYNNSLTK